MSDSADERSPCAETARSQPNAERPAEVIARRFHEEYEHLAPIYGWTTQAASRVRWDDLPDNQRRLMVHTVGNLLAMGVIHA